MTRPQSISSETDAVRTAVASLPLCTSSTAAALRRLLDIDDPIHKVINEVPLSKVSAAKKGIISRAPSKAAAHKSAAVGTSTTRSKIAKAIKPTVRNDDPVLLHHVSTLTASEKQKLATHVVNHTLRLLSEGLTPPPATTNATILTGLKCSRATKRVQAASPTCATPLTELRNDSSPKRSSNDLKSSMDSVADCSRTALAYLRATTARKPTSLPILTGISSLIARLIAHGMQTMALDELCCMRAYLEQQDETSSPSHELSPTALGPHRITFSVKLDTSSGELLGLVIQYHSHLLSLLSKIKAPALIEAAVDSLDPSNPLSPCATVLESLRREQGSDKAVRLLETQARMIESLCQNSRASVEPYLQPETAFKLQIFALELRASWWSLAEHRPDLDKELYHPLARALDSYTRMSRQPVEQKYHLASSLIDRLLNRYESRFKTPSVAMYKVYRSLSSIAQAAVMTSESLEILQPLLKSGQKSDHGRVVSACAQMRSLALRIGSKDQVLHLLEPLVQSMEDTIVDLSISPDEVAIFYTEQAALRQVSAFILSTMVKDKNIAVPVPDLQLIARVIFLSVETQMLSLSYTNATSSTVTKGSESVRDMIMKSSGHVINSTLMACRSIFQAEAQPPGNISSALDKCCALADRAAENRGGELHYVNLSNVHWLWSQSMDNDKLLTSESLDVLQKSINLLRRRSLKEQQAGFLSVKLEKLVSVLETMSRHSDALDRCSEALDLRLSSGALSDLVAMSQVRPLRSAACTEALRPLIRTMRVYQKIALHQELDICAFIGDCSDSTHLAALIEVQMYMLEQDQDSISMPQRVNQIQQLARRLMSLLDPEKHCVRIASCYACILRLEREAPGSFVIGFVEEARSYKLDLGMTSDKQELTAFHSFSDASLQLSQVLVDTKPSLQVMRTVLQRFGSTVDGCTSYSELQRAFDDLNCLVVQLKSVHDFMSLKSHDEGCQEVLQVLLRIHELERPLDQKAIIDLTTQLAAVQLRLGVPEMAKVTLDRAKLFRNLSPLDDIRLKLSTCQALLATRDIEALEKLAREVTVLLENLSPKGRSERDTTAWLRADLAFVTSSLHALKGDIHVAYVLGKNCIAITQAILNGWRGKATDHDGRIETSLDVISLTGKVRKLSMSGSHASSSRCQSEDRCKRSSANWPAVSLHLLGLQHLYTLCRHIGLRAEADYFANQARTLYSCIASGTATIQAVVLDAQHANALGVTPRTADVISTVDLDAAGNPLEVAKLYLLQAEIYARSQSWNKCAHSFGAADSVLLNLLKSMSQNQKGLQVKTLLSPGSSQKAEVEVKARSSSRKQPPSRKRPASQKTKACTKIGSSSRQVEQDAWFDVSSSEIAPIVNLRATGLINKADSLISQGHSSEAAEVLEQCSRMTLQAQTKMRQSIAEARLAMLRSLEEVAMDFTFNVLPESTLSFPALSSIGRRKSHNDEPGMPLLSSPSQAALKSMSPRNIGRKKRPPRHFTVSLYEARDQVWALQSRVAQSESMPVCYRICELALRSTVLLSAIDMYGSITKLHPTRAALSMEFPRIESIRRELSVLMVEASNKLNGHNATKSEDVRATLAATKFQHDYIDIIPETWAAVSLSMSEDCSELYIVRYQARRSPFLVRLPLVRHKLQDMDEDDDRFDYQEGYRELQEIIRLSNFSCHSTAKTSTPADRAAWWEEREALDRRLQELLFNIESIWLGGFRGVLSQHRREAELSARFRKSFETILDRHLPSRQNSKSRAKPLLLDSNVLQLFIGLGYGQDGDVDVDEQLLDLLYFVVDVLQFNGEHNAYDEIDFDSIATETLDALRSYHETANGIPDAEEGHLILILEKRLHAFPWESMPCLDGKSVSRVGSMLTLRERILAMHKQGRSLNGDRYMVNKSSGSYILNPSTDLTRTQERLEPQLRSLQDKCNSQWTAIVNHAPSEAEFKDALNTSAICLYFGHGSGDQYIRTRSIKKLDKCSEVVWLMGCSSGVVAENGEFEPTSVPMAYLIAGSHDRVGASYSEETDTEEGGRDGLCMAVVATLWDVTDGDIDRFSARAGEEWGLWSSSTTQRKDKLAAPKTPGKKIRGLLKTPVKTPGKGERLTTKGGEKQSLVQAVVKAREACHLRYLNGAAAVVYGVPVYLDG